MIRPLVVAAMLAIAGGITANGAAPAALADCEL